MNILKNKNKQLTLEEIQLQKDLSLQEALSRPMIITGLPNQETEDTERNSSKDYAEISNNFETKFNSRKDSEVVTVDLRNSSTKIGQGDVYVESETKDLQTKLNNLEIALKQADTVLHEQDYLIRQLTEDKLELQNKLIELLENKDDKDDKDE